MNVQLPQPTVEEVGRYYDQITDFYHIVWGESIHVGYWPDPAVDLPMAEAQDQYTDVMASYIKLQPGQRLLDVGCGTGQPAIRLAQATGGEVVGITISALQVERANQRAQEQGVSGQVRFELADAMAIPADDESFDAAWALETIFHMPDRGQVFREIMRILRPGGRLVIAEAFERAPLTDEQRAVIWGGVMANSYITLEAYERAVQEAGLVIDKTIDITTQTNNSLPKTIEALNRPDKQEQLRAFYDDDFIAMIQQAWSDLVDEYRRTMGYMMIVAHKPDQ